MAETQASRMLSGGLYDAYDPALAAARRRARDLTAEFNRTGDAEKERRCDLLGRLLGASGPNLTIEPPFHCDYGTHITFGRDVFLNFNCVFLDCNRITVGDRVLIGPGVQVYAATHPMDPEKRRKGLEAALPVTIGSDVWIGDGAVIAAGNPCRVIKPVIKDPIEA